MTEKVKGFWNKGVEFLKKVSKKVYIAIAVVLALLIVAVAIYINSRPYAVLFTGLSASETSSILSSLDSAGVTDYKVENNDTILVPKGQEPSLKARLLLEGYPQTGFSYSTYYDNVGALSTESERNNAYIHDLQDRMGAVIRCFDNVKDAVVTIAQGEDRGYVLDSGNVINASAGVLVTMDGSAKLTTQQATAIRNYVASAVQGLEIDSVKISDTAGNNYTAAGDVTADVSASALKIQLEEEYENKIRSEVLWALQSLFGQDNVKVGVNCVVELSQTTEERTDVYLPDWALDGSTNGKGIIGSQVYEYRVVRPGDDTVGGLVGSETNSDIPEYVEDVADPEGNETDVSGGGQIDYDNSRSEKYIVRTAGYLTDCTIAVTINSTTAGSVNLETIRQHVARAAGIVGTVDEFTGEEYLADKISVVAMPFYVEPASPIPVPELPVPMWVVYAAAAGLLLFIILLIIILRIRKKRKKKKAEERYKIDMEAFLAAAGSAQGAPTAGADVMSMQTERSMELRQDIRQFAEDNPEIAAQMIKAWLRGGEDE